MGRSSPPSSLPISPFTDRLLAHHQCSNPAFQLVGVHRQLLGLLETALEQTAQLLEGCDEAPEAEEGDNHAD